MRPKGPRPRAHPLHRVGSNGRSASPWLTGEGLSPQGRRSCGPPHGGQKDDDGSRTDLEDRRVGSGRRPRVARGDRDPWGVLGVDPVGVQGWTRLVRRIGWVVLVGRLRVGETRGPSKGGGVLGPQGVGGVRRRRGRRAAPPGPGRVDRPGAAAAASEARRRRRWCRRSQRTGAREPPPSPAPAPGRAPGASASAAAGLAVPLASRASRAEKGSSSPRRATSPKPSRRARGRGRGRAGAPVAGARPERARPLAPGPPGDADVAPLGCVGRRVSRLGGPCRTSDLGAPCGWKPPALGRPSRGALGPGLGARKGPRGWGGLGGVERRAHELAC